MKILITTVLAAATGAAALATPASAQPWRGYHYGPDYVCSRSGSKRSQDAVLGAVAGGLVGNQVAPTGNRTEGTLIGAAAGAVIGGQIGKNQAQTRCRYAGGGYYYDGGHHYEYRRHDNGRHRGWYKHHGRD
jgi:uncharacterized protein YcfJ